MDSDTDLEEAESRLYSQIYHSQNEEDEARDMNPYPYNNYSQSLAPPFQRYWNRPRGPPSQPQSIWEDRYRRYNYDQPNPFGSQISFTAFLGNNPNNSFAYLGAAPYMSTSLDVNFASNQPFNRPPFNYGPQYDRRPEFYPQHDYPPQFSPQDHYSQYDHPGRPPRHNLFSRHDRSPHRDRSPRRDSRSLQNEPSQPIETVVSQRDSPAQVETAVQPNSLVTVPTSLPKSKKKNRKKKPKSKKLPQNETNVTEVADLSSTVICITDSDESHSDDVIEIPRTPPPTYTIDSSDENSAAENEVAEKAAVTEAAEAEDSNTNDFIERDVITTTSDSAAFDFQQHSDLEIEQDNSSTNEGVYESDSDGSVESSEQGSGENNPNDPQTSMFEESDLSKFGQMITPVRERSESDKTDVSETVKQSDIVELTDDSSGQDAVTFSEPGNLKKPFSDELKDLMEALREQRESASIAEDVELNVTAEKNAFDFDLEEVIKSMPADPSRWKIIEADRLGPSRYRSTKCVKCKEFGHRTSECRRPRPVKCTLCASDEHFETRCPVKICTSCGNDAPLFTSMCGLCANRYRVVCFLCGMTGHNKKSCPDLWRRYHLTVSKAWSPF